MQSFSLQCCNTIDNHLSDWCLLAVKLGLVDKLPKLDTSSGALNKASQTARLLDEWEQHTSSKIGEN